MGITHHKTSLKMSKRAKKRESPVIEVNPFDKIGLTFTGHSSEQLTFGKESQSLDTIPGSHNAGIGREASRHQHRYKRESGDFPGMRGIILVSAQFLGVWNDWFSGFFPATFVKVTIVKLFWVESF